MVKESDLQWAPEYYPNEDGVIVGSLKNMEYLLPWWWMHFKLHNPTIPVTVINFGDMSETALNWCRQRARSVIDLNIPPDFVATKEQVDPQKAALWQATHHVDVWIPRQVWYQKTLALLKSPYERTVWIDLDIQTRGSISKMYDFANSEAGLSLCPDPDFLQQGGLQRGIIVPGEVMYNAGVIVYKRNSKIVEKWAQNTVKETHLFRGDQELISRLLFNLKPQMIPLDRIYNWGVYLGVNPQAILLHWMGKGKEALDAQINFLSQQLFFNLSFKSVF
jgi:hypothetical protein